MVYETPLWGLSGLGVTCASTSVSFCFCARLSRTVIIFKLFLVEYLIKIHAWSRLNCFQPRPKTHNPRHWRRATMHNAAGQAGRLPAPAWAGGTYNTQRTGNVAPKKCLLSTLTLQLFLACFFFFFFLFSHCFPLGQVNSIVIVGQFLAWTSFSFCVCSIEREGGITGSSSKKAARN